MSILPDNILRRMSKADRQQLGKAGKTAAECQAEIDIQTEKELQRQCCDLLRLEGITYLCPRMDRRTTIQTGWPDITFGYAGFACAWEVKLPGARLRPEQEEMHRRLADNGWSVTVIRSVTEARDWLRNTRNMVKRIAPEAYEAYLALKLYDK